MPFRMRCRADSAIRTCLKDVSDNLIFHLKRFEYDLETMRRSKINDHFEFPTTIDISSYNVDHLSDPSKPCQEDIFELVGVLVHQGTSENGHYYSYIRERPSSSGGMTNWFEFNDREVDHFDHQSLPYHTYGGFFDDQFPRTQKPFSAYMLFYQRRAAIEKDHAEYISSPRCGAPKVPVPSDLEAEIDTDNVEFVREYSLFDPNHSKFVRQILTTLKTVNHGACSEDHQQESQALHIVLEHLCQVIPRLRILDNFDETLLQLRRTVLPCPNCCHIVLRWLAMHDYALIGVLLRCLHAKVRSGVRNLMIDCLKAVREKDPALYSGVDNVDMDMEAGTPVPAEGILVEITRRLRGVADETSLGTRGWDEFYMTMCQISSMGLPETAVVLNTGFLEFCLRILLMHAHVPSRTFNPDIWRLIEKKKPIFNRLIELVYTLLSKMDIRLPYELLNSQNGDRMQAIDRTSQKFPLSLREHQLLHFWHDENRAYAVLDKMIEQYDSSKSEVFYPGEVLKWMLQSTEPVIQNNLCTTVSEGVQSLNSPFNDPYVRAALPFCEVCPVVPNIIKVIDAVAKSATGLRDTGGDAHIQFFTALLTARNEVAFDEKDPDLFYKYLLYRSKVYAVPLLIYDDDGVRKATAMHLEELFAKHKSDEESDQEALGYKYRSVRSLVKDMNAKIAEEHNNGTSRIYMQPMVATCALLNQMLELLDNTESEVMLQYQGPNDRTLIDYFHQNVEARLRVWPPDEGTPISPNGKSYTSSCT
jgi:ubiquitin carboxyl-terminal hydrolase 34